jgi:hypothetical protein
MLIQWLSTIAPRASKWTTIFHKIRPLLMTLEIQVLARNKHKHGWVKSVNGTSALSLLTIQVSTNNKKKKNLHIFVSFHMSFLYALHFHLLLFMCNKYVINIYYTYVNVNGVIFCYIVWSLKCDKNEVDAFRFPHIMSHVNWNNQSKGRCSDTK